MRRKCWASYVIAIVLSLDLMFLLLKDAVLKTSQLTFSWRQYILTFLSKLGSAFLGSSKSFAKKMGRCHQSSKGKNSEILSHEMSHISDYAYNVWSVHACIIFIFIKLYSAPHYTLVRSFLKTIVVEGSEGRKAQPKCCKLRAPMVLEFLE